MKAEKILESAMIDILFEYRNKAYGAYELRTNYPLRMRKAIVTSISAMVLLFVLLNSFTTKTKKATINNIPPVIEIAIKKPNEEIKKKEESKKAPKKGVDAKARPKNPPMSAPDFTTKINEVKSNNPNWAANPNGNPNLFTGDFDEEPIGDPDGENDGDKDLKKKIIPVENKDTTKVEQPNLPNYTASYVGGWNAFSDYLQDNLSDEAVEDNMDKKVSVSYWIEADGSVSNVNTYGNDDVDFLKKAKKVFEKMKKWKPAVTNGTPIRIYKEITVTIVLPE
jgi:periplasmic protein TonB